MGLASKFKNVFLNIKLLISSYFWKRNKKVILVGSWFGEKFADNSRFLFQYLAEHKQVLGLEEVVWVTRNNELCLELRNMGYNSVMMYSKESYFYHKHAGIHIICNNPVDTSSLKGDINGIFSFGAIRIDLWHGIGLKGVGFSSNEYKNMPFLKRIIKEYLGPLNYLAFVTGPWYRRYVLSTTSATTEIFKKYFRLPEKLYIESAYPRNCKPIRLLEEETQVLDKFNNYSKVVLYLPTFRTGNDKFEFSNFSKVLESTLKENDILWVQKAHSADENNEIRIGVYENVLNLDSNFDINVLLPHITLLVTDYSSVMFDAMYHWKPIVYLVPDFDEYKNGDRGFVINPDEVMIGPRLYSIEKLKEKLGSYCSAPEKVKSKEYEVVRNKYWGTEIKELKDIWYDIYSKINAR